MELEYRVKVNPNELSSLLAECHSAWVSVRQALMGSRVNDEVARMDPANSDLIDLVCLVLLSRRSCTDHTDAIRV